MEDNRIIAVIDLKAFYAYTECILRGLDPFSTPLVVADKDRGKNTIVLSVSPYLKAHGIPSRCRIKELPKKFDYIYAIPRMETYIRKSNEVMQVLLEFVSEEDLHIYSIDEAFLDLTSYLSYYKKTPRELVKYIINRIKEKTGLCATGGIGNNLFLAKIALDNYAKKSKDGIDETYLKDVKKKVWPLTPLSNVWGIGARLEARLNALGLFTMQDIAMSNVEYLQKIFGVIGEEMYNHSHGIDEADIHEIYIPKEKSLSIGQVLFKDYTVEEAKLIIEEMVDDLSLRLRMQGCLASVVHLYIGYADDGGFARQMSLLFPSDDTETLLEGTFEIYHRFVLDRPIRRISISFGKLVSLTDHEQLSLFVDPDEQLARRSLSYIVDEIKCIFGEDKIMRASSLLPHSTLKERHSYIGGHRR